MIDFYNFFVTKQNTKLIKLNFQYFSFYDDEKKERKNILFNLDKTFLNND